MQQEARTSTKNRYPRLSEELELDERWIPLLDYLSTFGLKESHFIQMYERHMPSLQINAVSARERLEYLLSVGVKNRDIKKILLRQPQILEYTLDKNLKTHVAFLVSLGIPDSRIGQIISATPSLFSYSVENSLKPTVKYLLEEVGIKKDELRKVVQLSPQILVQRIDTTWNTRFTFLTKELGAPRDNIVKMVRKHPQLLHYSIEDGLLPRINFLRSIGMCNSDIIKVLTSLTQVNSIVYHVFPLPFIHSPPCVWMGICACSFYIRANTLNIYISLFNFTNSGLHQLFFCARFTPIISVCTLQSRCIFTKF